MVNGTVRCPDCGTQVAQTKLPRTCSGCGAYLVAAVERKDNKTAGDPRRQDKGPDPRRQRPK